MKRFWRIALVFALLMTCLHLLSLSIGCRVRSGPPPDSGRPDSRAAEEP